MLDLVHEVQEVQNVHALLLSTVKQVRALHATLSALMTDVAAIRRTLLQGPGNFAHYENHLRSAIETAKPIVDEAMQSYDEMIRQIEESEAWRN
jgi:septation ring formation regulator EzrA